ncbi:MAG: arginine--tRNA ligase [Rickettsiaceae bacterium]|nr:arginine--tRNA ligase [Rickettsiaceae bacterium]
MNIFDELWRDLRKNGQVICQDETIWEEATLEIPKDHLNGDISTNLAMIIAARQKKNPRAISLELKEHFLNIEYLAHIEVAGPGFINFTIKASKWHECINSILSEKTNFWDCNIGNGHKINVEFVSANPTGPMHVGHARGAVYGDVLANILLKCGYKVTKEYYINDAGSQIDTLLDSAFIRYKEAITGETLEIEEGLYPGDYLINIGQKLAKEFGKELLSLEHFSMRQKIKKIVVDAMLDLIKFDLDQLGVHHDVFVSEQSLHNNGDIDKAVEILRNKGLIYRGFLPAPKGKIDENWQPKEQLLFKSSDYGDDQDRPVQKSDNSWSYLAADFAYAKNKIERGFETLIYILGADHSGYVKRIKAVIDALGEGKVQSDIRISQLVNFVKQGKPIKMSKRSGNFMTVSDVTNYVSKDIIRFIMLTRRNDMTLDFDFDKVKEQSKDNPVFYVQYAHVRLNSILSKAQEVSQEAYQKFVNREFDLSLLSSEIEIQLIKTLAAWPRTLFSAAKFFEPQRIAYYLIDVASQFHTIWHLGKGQADYRFVMEDSSDYTAAKLALAEAIKRVLQAGFEVIGIEPMEKM